MTHIKQLADILSDSLRPLKLISMVLYFLAAIGMWMQHDHDTYNDLKLLLDNAPWWAWFIVCLDLGLARYIALFQWPGNAITRQVTALFGLFLWCFFFAGSAIVTPMEGMALLYLIPILMETWLLGRAFDEDARWNPLRR